MGVRGICSPHISNSVMGELVAPLGPLNEMKEWLKTQGTPESVSFSPTEETADYFYDGPFRK